MTISIEGANESLDMLPAALHTGKRCRQIYAVQSMEETENFVRMAMQAPQQTRLLRFDNDDFIDDAITADAEHQFRPTGRFNAEDW